MRQQASQYLALDVHQATTVARRKRKRTPLTRGLNRNHNPILKSVFKGAANAATARPGPLRDFYEASRARGVRDELAKVTLARKIVSIARATLEERRALGSEQADDTSDIAPGLSR